MKPRITVITLAVENLDRSLRFYRDGLGLTTAGVVGEEFENGAVAFFELQPGLQLAIWPRASLARDAGLSPCPPCAGDFSLGHNVSSPAAVRAMMEEARAAGAVIVKEAEETFWGGYAGYFIDPDEHLWEVVWNPQLAVDD